MTTGTANAEQTETREYVFGIPLVDLPSYKAAPPIGNKLVRKADFINFPLLEEILAYLEAHPNQWEQDNWFRVVDLNSGYARYESEKVIMEEVNSCGTTMCFAGHAALRMGFPVPPKDNGKIWTREVVDEGGDAYNEEVFIFAQNVLGLTYSQGDALFASVNTLLDLHNIIEALRLAPDIDGEDLEDMVEAKSDDVTVREYLLDNGFIK